MATPSTTLSTMPQKIDIEHYGGDTLVIHVNISTTDIAGRTCAGQVRRKETASKIDASFVVTTTASGVDLTLEAADCKKLSAFGDYEGVWDAQFAPPGGGDPVTTIGFGDLLIHPDVTRLP